MILVVLTVAAALLVGRLRGGRFRNLAEAPIRAGAFVGVAALAQFLHALAPGRTAAVALTVVSEAALLAFLWSNRYLAGVLLAALGSLMNTVVIVANGAMPVSADALFTISRHPAEVTPGRHRLLTDGDVLPWLADTIGLPVLRTVVSVGDVVLAAGLALLVMDLMRQRAPRVRTAGSPRSH
jgi:Family of unknown function (DUF5317)